MSKSKSAIWIQSLSQSVRSDYSPARDNQLSAFEASVAQDVAALISGHPGFDSISYSYHRLNGRLVRSTRGLH